MRYFAYSLSKIKQITYYKFNFYSNIVGTLVMFYVQFFLWKSIYDKNNVLADLTFSDMFIFILFSTIMTKFLGSGIEREVGEKLRNGNTVIDLVKPIDIVIKDYFEEFGRGVIDVITVSLPLIIVLLIKSDTIMIPANRVGYFIIMALISFTIYFLLSYLFGLISFWTKSVIGIAALKTALWGVMAGSIVPLDFYPDWLYRIVRIMPFRFTCYEPVSILMKNMEPSAIYKIIVLQTLWCLALMVIVFLLKCIALRKYVAQGG